MLYIIGLGLSTEYDLTLRGLSLIDKCDLVYLESYTGVFERLKELEDLTGKSIMVLSRQDVENGEELLKNAKKQNVALLVSGDPLCATTHISIVLECIKRKIKYTVVNNASIFSAISRTGLSIYKFGKTASIPFPEKNFNPKSFYKIIEDNQKINAHTLCLLDVKSDAHDYMTIPEAIEIIKKVDKKNFLKEKIIGCARLGYKDEVIKYDSADKLKKYKWPKAPHCIVIPAKELHFMEEEALKKIL